MTILPPYEAPYKPVPQVTPLTYRDGITMLEKLKGIIRYINRELVPFVNDNMEELGDAFETQVNALIEAVNAAIELVLNDSVQVQDPVVAALVADVNSLTNNALETLFDNRYAPKATAVISATDYGVIANGVANDTTALQNAINAAASSDAGIVRLPLGTMPIGAITIPSNVSIVGAGKGLSILKQVGAPAYLLNAAGTLTANVTTATVTINVNDTIITVANSASFAVGDIIVLHDNFSYNPGDALYKSGEMLRIQEIISPTQIRVYGGVRGSWANVAGQYTTTNVATLSKLVPVKGINLSNFSIDGDPTSTTTLLMIQCAYKVNIDSLDVIKGGSTGIRIYTSHTVSITNYTVCDLTDNLPNGNVGYGVAITGPSEEVTVTGGIVVRARHGVTTMGSVYGFPHNVIVTGMNIRECSAAGLDTHAAGEDISYVGNVVTQCGNGISVRSRGTSVIGNRISKIPVGHGINFAETLLKNISAKGNTIEDVITGGFGITVGAPAVNVSLEDNFISRVGGDGIGCDAGSSNVTISRNTIKNIGMALTNRAHIRPNTTSGTPATSGWFMTHNTLIQDTGVGSANRAIDTLASSLTGAYVAHNICAGTFVSQPFNNTNPFGFFNRQVGMAPPAVTGAKGGNVALASVIARMVSDGQAIDSTTA